MKIILLTLAALLLAMPLHAAPMFVVDATLTEKHADDSVDGWEAKPVAVADGTPALLHLGGVDLKVTPAMQKDGHILVPLFITRGSGKNMKLISRPSVTTRAGQVITVGVGDLTFKVTVNFAK